MSAYALSGYLFTKFSARTLFVVCFVLSGLAGLAILFTLSDTDASYSFVFFVMCARFGVAAAFNIVYVGHPRMFPTLFSITSMGFCNIFARTVTFFAPIIAEVDEPTPIVIFTVLCTVTTFSAFFLKEAK